MQKRNKFDHSHVNSTTFKMGYDVPVAIAECLPGDTWQGNTQLFMRIAPTIAPVMHRLNITTKTVFVPMRLLWKNSENFLTGGKDGMDNSVPPYVMIAPTQGSLADYLGLPLCDKELKVSALPFRAYAMIYNWMTRDQDLQDELPISLEDGEDTTTSVELMRTCWAKDYFTTARPWPQKGPGITVPIVGDGGIIPNGILRFTEGDLQSDTKQERNVSTGFGVNEGGIGLSRAWTTGSNGSYYTNTTNNALVTGSSQASSLDAGNSQLSYLSGSLASTSSAGVTPFGVQSQALSYLSGLALSGSIGVDINDLLEAMAMQRTQTRRALFGSRYEDLLHYWGLKTQDFRLQEPELVSVGRGRVQFSEVLQTSPDSSGEGVGQMAGHGVGAMQSGRFRYYCHEHGFLLTLVTVRPQAVYTQGIERMWTRETRWDYWSPEMQHIGQQEVLSKEVYADGTDADNDIFGYQNRFDEYRRGKNHVSGEFRTTQDYWNMARVFENRPSLNSQFVECDPTDRIFQLSESLSDQLYCMVQNNFIAKRLLSRNGNPM